MLPDIHFGNFKMDSVSISSLEPHGSLCSWSAWFRQLLASQLVVSCYGPVTGKDSREYHAQRISAYGLMVSYFPTAQ